jgi:hypothetical protein
MALGAARLGAAFARVRRPRRRFLSALPGRPEREGNQMSTMTSTMQDRSRQQGFWMLALVAGLVLAPSAAHAVSSIGGIMAHSPDDISGFTSLTGDDNTVSVTLPFTFTVQGTNYTTIVLSTNGWIEFGANTSGNSDNSNTCLPTADHTNPFLAAYWDDLVPFGTNIRYGTVGTSPNRVFIADYETDLFSPPGVEGSDDVRFQI